MNKLALLALLLTSACDKSGSAAAKAAADQAAAAKASAAEKAAKPAPVEPAIVEAAIEPPGPPESTGVLDLQLQRIPGAGGKESFRVLSPRVTIDLNTRPAMSKEDMAAPDGSMIPAAIGLSSNNTGADGFLYLPIPKDRVYNVETGIKGARDGFMKMFDPGYKAKDEPAKLGPFDATHVIADGERGGMKLHVEAWIAWDASAYTMYGVMALRMQGDATGVAALASSFKLRDGQTVGK